MSVTKPHPNYNQSKMVAKKSHNREYDYLFKILFIGDSSVGKSSILARYIDNSFSEDFTSTIGVDFRVKTFDKGDDRVKIQLWDTAGQERFSIITSSYYRGCHGIFMVYDVCNENSFNNLDHWISEFKKYVSNSIPIILIGNKVDLPNRKVKYADAFEWANSKNIPYYELSAKTANGIEAVVEKMYDSIMIHMQNSNATDKTTETLNISEEIIDTTKFDISGVQNYKCC